MNNIIKIKPKNILNVPTRNLIKDNLIEQVIINDLSYSSNSEIYGQETIVVFENTNTPIVDTNRSDFKVRLLDDGDIYRAIYQIKILKNDLSVLITSLSSIDNVRVADFTNLQSNTTGTINLTANPILERNVNDMDNILTNWDNLTYNDTSTLPGFTDYGDYIIITDYCFVKNTRTTGDWYVTSFIPKYTILGYDLNVNSSTYGDNAENSFSISENQFINNFTYINSTGQGGEVSSDHIGNQILSKYKKGKEPIVLTVNYSDYYDVDGNKIYTEGEGDTIKVGDIVRPYIINQGNEEPISKNYDGTAKDFRVTSSEISSVSGLLVVNLELIEHVEIPCNLTWSSSKIEVEYEGGLINSGDSISQGDYITIKVKTNPNYEVTYLTVIDIETGKRYGIDVSVEIGTDYLARVSKNTQIEVKSKEKKGIAISFVWGNKTLNFNPNGYELYDNKVNLSVVIGDITEGQQYTVSDDYLDTTFILVVGQADISINNTNCIISNINSILDNKDGEVDYFYWSEEIE